MQRQTNQRKKQRLEQMQRDCATQRSLPCLDRCLLTLYPCLIVWLIEIGRHRHTHMLMQVWDLCRREARNQGRADICEQKYRAEYAGTTQVEFFLAQHRV